jgi:hypothetical protein
MLILSLNMEAICSSETSHGLYGVTFQKIVSILKCYFASSEFVDRWIKRKYNGKLFGTFSDVQVPKQPVSPPPLILCFPVIYGVP